MKSLQKYLLVPVFTVFFLSACGQQPQSEEKPDKNNQSSFQMETPPPTDAQITPSETEKKPALPSSPTQSLEEAAKELGMTPEELSKTSSIPTNIENLDLKQVSQPKPDAQALEAMNLDSSKDCASYAADVLKQICYNARGLSDNSSSSDGQ